MNKKLIQIGETLHASIPSTAKSMKALLKKCDSKPLEHIKEIITSQSQADYIGINVDEFGESSTETAIKQMKTYIELVHKYSSQSAICIDSGYIDVLTEGLKHCYSLNPAKPPLVNSVKLSTMDVILPLRKDYDFSVIALLITENDDNSDPVEKMYLAAKEIFAQAIKAGFTADQIYYDTQTYPLAIDIPMSPGQSSYCYNAFEAIKKIKADPQMQGVHFSLGLSNCARNLPARKVGICRAYLQVAMEAGLDAAIVNTEHKFGQRPADEQLVKLVKAFAALDGDADKLTDAMTLMSKFCTDNKAC